MDDEVNEEFMFGDHQGKFVAPWQPTVLKEFELAVVEWNVMTSKDVLLDLGCGDGRVVTFACKRFGCQGIGWDISSKCIDMAQKLAVEENVQHNVEFHQVDVASSTISTAPFTTKCPTIIYVYLLLPGLQKIQPLLHDLVRINPNVFIITNHYHFQDNDGWMLIKSMGEFNLWKGVTR